MSLLQILQERFPVGYIYRIYYVILSALNQAKGLTRKMHLDKKMAGTYAALLSESPGRQSLLNAEFTSVWYLSDNNGNVQGIRAIKPLTKELSALRRIR